MTDTCGTCRFLDRSESTCRRYPPQQQIGRWPYIGEPFSEWCGEHKPREDTESADASTA